MGKPLTDISITDIANNDVVGELISHVVDPNDPSETPEGTSKRITLDQTKAYVNIGGKAYTTSSEGTRTYYSTVQEGINAADAGGLDSVSLNTNAIEDLDLKDGVNINGNGYTLTGTDLAYVISMTDTVDVLISDLLVTTVGAVFGGMNVSDDSVIRCKNVVFDSGIVALSVVAGTVIGGASIGGIVSISLGARVQNFDIHAIDNACSVAGELVNCFVFSENGYGLNTFQGSLVDNCVVKTEVLHALNGGGGDIQNCSFSSILADGAQIGSTFSSGFEGTFKNCKFKTEASTKVPVLLGNLSTAKFRFLDCVFVADAGGTYGMNATSAQEMLVNNCYFNSPDDINGGFITLDNRIGDNNGNFKID